METQELNHLDAALGEYAGCDISQPGMAGHDEAGSEPETLAGRRTAVVPPATMAQPAGKVRAPDTTDYIPPSAKPWWVP